MNIYKDNRELSWLKFNDRVLMQAKDENVPLGERLTFISIFQTNLDEFFRVRMGFLFDQDLFYPALKENKTNMTSSEQIKACERKVKYLYKKRDKIYASNLEKMKEYGIEIVGYDDIKDKEDKKFLEHYFTQEMLPLVSPQVVSKRQPFPFLNNGELYIVTQLESKKGKRKMGIVSCSAAFDERLIALPSKPGKFILAEEIVKKNLPMIFHGQTVKNASIIRIIRSADIEEDDYSLQEHEDYREMMETLIKQRRKLAPLRMEMSPGLEEIEVDMLKHFLDLSSGQVFEVESPLEFSFVFTLQDYLKSRHPELFYKRLEARNSPLVENTVPMIKQVLKHDILLSYPFESMAPFLRFLDEASRDPQVISIKMALYRVAKNSKVVKSLIRAAENGKDVTVLVELRARFDEENNIAWSKQLESAGCHVIYGLSELKVHSKLCLVTYRTDEGIKYLTQIGTGNYNEKTSKLYTDFCLMTSEHAFGEEANELFTHLCLGETDHNANILLVAPHCMISRIFEKIDEQIKLAKAGKPAYVGFKCNAVTSKKMIEKLVEASQAGVKIQLIVRGICCIIPGIKGYTENIQIISIVGRYLEHSRIYIFGDKDPDVYISSADLMTRNLERRVEVGAPIHDPRIKKTILNMFDIMLHDNVKASRLLNDGTYKRVKNKQEKINSQEYFFKKKV